MKVLIAGGLGYIGSALCEIYRERTDWEIIVLDKAFVPERVAALPSHMRYVQADIQDVDRIRPLLKNVDVLHLLAAEVEAEKSIHKERAIWLNNFEAPKALIEACPKSTRVLFPATGNVFGGVDENDKYLDLTEEDEPKPKYPYAEAKRAMEEYLLGTDRDFVILRFGTNHGYAPGIRFNLVTNVFFQRALMGQDITVHGTGTNYRPTVCTKDCARALDFLSAHENAGGEIFHVVHENIRIKDLAQRIVSHFDTGTQVTHVAKEVPFNAYGLNSDKIREYGFEFKWSLDDSIRDMQRVFQAVHPLADK